MSPDAAPIVVDASVLVKVVLDEPERPAVVAGLRRATENGAPLLVLPHTRYEVGNALLRMARLARRPAADVDRGLLDAMLLVDVAEDPPDVASVAFRHGLTYYDAAYLALAAAVPGARLWTYDDALTTAARKAERWVSASDVGR